MKNILLTSIIFILSILQMQAQHLSDAYYAQTINQTQINPAYTQTGEESRLMIFHRSLLSGLDGAPSNTAISFLKPLDDHTGVGGRLTSDSRGVFSTMMLEGFVCLSDCDERKRIIDGRCIRWCSQNRFGTWVR